MYMTCKFVVMSLKLYFDNFHIGNIRCSKYPITSILSTFITFEINATHKTVPVLFTDKMTSETNNPIYQLICNFCDKQCITKTSNPLHVMIIHPTSNPTVKLFVS